MTLKIVSDGTFHGSQLVDQSGQPVAAKMRWEPHPTKPGRARARAYMDLPDIELVLPRGVDPPQRRRPRPPRGPR